MLLFFYKTKESKTSGTTVLLRVARVTCSCNRVAFLLSTAKKIQPRIGRTRNRHSQPEIRSLRDRGLRPSRARSSASTIMTTSLSGSGVHACLKVATVCGCGGGASSRGRVIQGAVNFLLPWCISFLLFRDSAPYKHNK